MARKKSGTRKVKGTVAARSARVGPQGRVVIPAKLRKELGLVEGDSLEAVDLGPETVTFRIRHQAAALAELQERWQRYGNGRSLVRELIADRRKEAKREREEG